MGLFDRLRNATPAGVASAATAGAVQGTLGAIGQTAIDIRTAITGEAPLDPVKRAELEAKLAEIEASIALAQSETNKIEAQSTSVFIAGARPAVLWVCVLALFYNFVARPVLVACGVAAAPEIDAASLWPIMGGILGLGFYRTVEKSNGSVGLH